MRRFITGGLLVAVTLLGLPFAAAAQNGGAAVLQITPSARADGMGQAYVALADDPAGAWWNPAGLGFQRSNAAMTNYVKLVPGLADDVYHVYLGYLHHSQNWGTFAASVSYLSYGTNIITGPNSNGGTDSLGTFTSSELSPALSFGTMLTHGVAMGFNVKLVRVNLAPTSALAQVGITGSGSGSSVALDIGLLGRDSVKLGGEDMELSGGVSILNLGPKISFVDQAYADDLPRTLRVGAAGRLHFLPGYSAMATLELQKSMLSGGDQIWHAGSEIELAGTLAGRAGFVHDPNGDISSMTYGLGVKISGMELDFASIPQATGLDRVKKFDLLAHF